jgi:hypothetical protein
VRIDFGKKTTPKNVEISRVSSILDEQSFKDNIISSDDLSGSNDASITPSCEFPNITDEEIEDRTLK